VHPETRYARSGDVSIAYQVVGDGPFDLVFVPPFVTHAELWWSLRQLVRFRGRELDTAGDGFFASFDGPARAIRCAHAIVDSVSELGLDVRAGLHTGECEVVDGKVAGIAVHTGARVAALASAGEVLVSSTVKDLVAGSGIGFEDRGKHDLKGVGEWHVYALAPGT
jgi:class 3 adenylate cyclase